MNDTTLHLTFNDHRIDDITHVVNTGVVNHFDFAGVFVDLNHTNVSAVREGEVFWVVEH